MEELKNKLIKMINTINNMQEMFKDEDVSVIFALEELKEQCEEMLRVINKEGK